MENESSEPLDYIKGVIESLLFVNERPVSLEQIKRVLETVTPTEIKKAIAALQESYLERNSGITIEEIAGGYQMLSNPKYVTYVRKFYKTKHKEKLSKPALETLAIIAYKQPVTRGDVELIRGVNSDGVVSSLLNKELIKMTGRKDIPGRPFLYGTTKQFLEYFGLKSLDTLPNLEELEVLDQRMNHADEASDEGIPESALAVNSLERQKQRAIAEAERGTADELVEGEQGVNNSDQQELEASDPVEDATELSEGSVEQQVDSDSHPSDQERIEESLPDGHAEDTQNDLDNTEDEAQMPEHHEEVASTEDSPNSEAAITDSQSMQSETQGGTATLEAVETTAEDKDTDEPK